MAYNVPELSNKVIQIYSLWMEIKNTVKEPAIENHNKHSWIHS